jgi:sugar/nucleoside kinase (ribokinase family)
MVWDTIHQREAMRAPLQEWGGIGYALGALSAALPQGWEVIPLVKVGRDLAEEAMRFLREIPRVRVDEGIVVVTEPNNRVELRYGDGMRRSERLTGGVPPWKWGELAPRVARCHALYVNFISGYEMELEAARALRVGFPGPVYADLHSLFLGLGQEGMRVPRPLPAWEEWLRCFDAVQMNEDEFELLGRARGDPWALAAEVVGPDLKLVCVTLGERGAAYVSEPAFDPDPFTWPGSRERVAAPGPCRSGRVPVAGLLEGGDPTGCGDVWGATFFARLLARDSLEEAMASANRSAARNVAHRGARGLHHHLQGRLAPGSERV